MEQYNPRHPEYNVPEVLNDQLVDARKALHDVIGDLDHKSHMDFETRAELMYFIFDIVEHRVSTSLGINFNEIEK